MFCTDEAGAYEAMPDYQHEQVVHSAKQLVQGQCHTSGIEYLLGTAQAGLPRDVKSTTQGSPH